MNRNCWPAFYRHACATQWITTERFKSGVMYLFGEGVEKNATEAIHWLELAGESGLAGAWSTLGMMFMEGQGRELYVKAGFNPDEFS